MRPALTVSCGTFEADRSRQPARVPECKTVEAGIFEIGICELPKLYDTLTYYPIQIPTKIVMHHENLSGTH